MRLPFSIAASAVLLLATGCTQVALDWEASDTPKQLHVETTRTEHLVVFSSGAVEISPAESARLVAFVAAGGIRPADRIVLETTGTDPQMAQMRRDSVTAALRTQRVGAVVSAAPGGSPGSVTVAVYRSSVTLPAST